MTGRVRSGRANFGTPGDSPFINVYPINLILRRRKFSFVI